MKIKEFVELTKYLYENDLTISRLEKEDLELLSFKLEVE